MDGLELLSIGCVWNKTFRQFESFPQISEIQKNEWRRMATNGDEFTLLSLRFA
jgi:hypothetical protein